MNMNRNFGHLNEWMPSSYLHREMKLNEDSIRQMVKQEFYSLISPFQKYQQSIAKISKKLKNEISNNKLKINDIEYKLNYNKPFFSIKSSSSDDNNFLKKDEFEIKMKEINKFLSEINIQKNNIVPELNSSLKNIKFNSDEISSLKYNYNYIVSQIEHLKKDLNEIKISKDSISKK